MPIYEFECLACGKGFERLLRASDSPGECPSCGHENVQRVISLCGVTSDTSRAANLSAAHRSAATRRSDKARAEHAQNHDHFGDAAHR